MLNYVFVPLNPALIIANGSGNCCGISPIVGIIIILFYIWFISKMMKNG